MSQWKWRCHLKRSLSLAVVLLFLSCETLNSNSFDEELYGGEPIEDPSLVVPFAILRRHCMGCHTHSGWSNYVRNSDWELNGYIVRGDASASKLIKRMKNTPAGETDLTPNMPTEGDIVSDSDYEELRSWINGL